jgi:hypothetical protein
MSHASRAVAFTALSILLGGASASAETMRCQSINGNVNCAGSGAVSCQTIDGKKVCVSGHGDVVQSFGNRSSIDTDITAGDEDKDDTSQGPALEQHLERQDSRGRTLMLQRDGSRLHLRSDWLSIDRD